MGWLSNKINRDQLKPGDHIYSWRTAYLYAHHGIYVGEGKVIHFAQAARGQIGTGIVSYHSIFSSCSSHSSQNPYMSCDEPSVPGGVILESLDCFLSGDDLYRFEYGVSRAFFFAKVRGGTCTFAKSDPPEDVLYRAFYLLPHGFGSYSLFENNCEDFAIYCKTGLCVSKGRSGQAAFFSSSAKGIVCYAATTIVATICASSGVAAGIYCYNQYVCDIGIRRDVSKTPVESLVIVLSAGSPPHPSSTRFLTYEELKLATNNFTSAFILGEDRFGHIFKGVLSDGTAVAIKRLTNGGHQGDKEFLVVVEMLSRLHHRNLVKLVGYYSSRDSSQNLLCYELVPNGSLEAWLHGPLGVNCPLDWNTRVKIALDAARGLAYLHEDSQPCVIHRDFKASNILLGKDFHAKVADFGLAKLAPEGTFGYVAPQHTMNGDLLVKTDVYSYGIVLLELLSGRRPVDMSQPSGKENLVTWARSIHRDKNQLKELADPTLGAKFQMEDFERVCSIAVSCVASESSQRPTMGEVVRSLSLC